MLFYKYTKIDFNFLDMLDKEYLYCSETKYFDDIFDGKMPFDQINTVTFENVKKILSEEGNYFYSMRGLDKEEILDEIGRMMKEIDLSDVTSTSEDSQEPSQNEIDLNTFANKIENFFSRENVVNDFQKILKLLFKMQDSLRVCSLSISNKNPILWSMYADNFKGACIAYDLLIEDLHKVKYGERYSFDPLFEIMMAYYYKKDIDNEYLKIILTNLVLTKASPWEFQEEYRYIKYNKNPEDIEGNKTKCKIKNIYLGFKVPKEKSDLIVSKFKDKFDIFDMEVDHYNQNFSFNKIN